LGLEGTFSEGVTRDAVLLGSLLPYAQAAQGYAQMSGIALSSSTLLRLTRRAGDRYVGVLETEALVAWKALATEPTELPFEREAPAERMNLSMDGTTVNVRGEGWKEVKVAVVSAVEAQAVEGSTDPPEPSVSLKAPSYRAGLWEARAFERQQWAEGVRRGLDRTPRLSSVNDGARYLWEIVGNCYPAAVEVVDWWHAVDHLWKAAQAVHGRGTEKERAWVAAQKDRLWKGRTDAVIQAFDELSAASETVQETVETHRTYFSNNQSRMHYAEYRAQGCPIGSGSVEGGGCKQVVGGRLKQAGMRWSKDGANAVLALRSALFSQRWDQVWTSS
jgi:hypothetical protein